MSTASLHIADPPRRGTGEAFRPSSGEPGTFDDLIGSVCMLLGAEQGVLHRSGADGFPCHAAFSRCGRPFLADIEQLIALRSRAVCRPGGNKPAALAFPVGARALDDLWIGFAFAAGDEEGLRRLYMAQEAVRSLVASHIDAWYALIEAQRREAMLAAAIDQSDCGIVVLRPDLSAGYRNRAAQRILTERDGLELRRGVPRPLDQAVAVRFQDALERIVDESGAPASMMLVERQQHQRPLVMVLAPGTALGVERNDIAAILYLVCPEHVATQGLEPICQLHGLSPVEAQLVAHLMAGSTVNEAAATMRVKPDTARAYLKQIFVKTDTHRQAELLQLFARYQRAVRGDLIVTAI